jgi:subtilisin family serine protease
MMTVIMLRTLLLLLILGIGLAHWSEREPVQSPQPKSMIRGANTDNQERRRTKGKDKDAKEKKAKKAKERDAYISSRGGNQGAVEYHRLMVEYFDSDAKEVIADHALNIIREMDDHKMMVVEMDEATMHRLAAQNIIKSGEIDSPVEASGSVQQVHLDGRMLAETVPYGIKMIQADQLEVGKAPVKVCIIDTGYDIGHPDLPKNTTGDNAVNKFGEVWDWKIDFNGHGTHLAGTIAALGNNDIGVVGAGAIPLHITRGLDDQSNGFESDILDAVEQCVASGAKIISLSLGGMSMSTRSRNLYTRVVNQDGVMVIAASGNQGGRIYEYPASHPDVISVTAVYEWGKYWEGSNYGDQVELAAPGHAVLSTSTTLTAVYTFDFSYSATQIAGSRTIERSSVLVDCGNGNMVCNIQGPGGICLMARDQTDFRTMVRNCEDGGGIGAIIFDANPNMNMSYQAHRMDIPVVVVQRGSGVELLRYIGTKVSFGFHSANEPEHTYAYYQGTSMAVPHVAGAAALVWSHFPECNNHEIRYALDISAQDQGLSGCDWDYGYGIVKAKNAYDWLKKNPCGKGNFGQPNRGGGCATV